MNTMPTQSTPPARDGNTSDERLRELLAPAVELHQWMVEHDRAADNAADHAPHLPRELAEVVRAIGHRPTFREAVEAPDGAVLHDADTLLVMTLEAIKEDRFHAFEYIVRVGDLVRHLLNHRDELVSRFADWDEASDRVDMVDEARRKLAASAEAVAAPVEEPTPAWVQVEDGRVVDVMFMRTRPATTRGQWFCLSAADPGAFLEQLTATWSIGSGMLYRVESAAYRAAKVAMPPQLRERHARSDAAYLMLTAVTMMRQKGSDACALRLLEVALQRFREGHSEAKASRLAGSLSDEDLVGVEAA